MSGYEVGLDLLKMMKAQFKTPGLGSSIDALERLNSSQATGLELQAIIERLPQMARIATTLWGVPGARDELEHVIRELEEKFTNLRELQARRSFEAFGEALGAITFKQYLNGTDNLEGIMEIPEFTLEWMEYFEETLLVDGRVLAGHARSVGLVETCKLAKLRYDGNDMKFVPFDPERVEHGLRWTRFQDGWRNHNRQPSDRRRMFQKFEVGADVMEGIARYVQGESVIHGYYMALLGSVHYSDWGFSAYLGVVKYASTLYWDWHGYYGPVGGSASRGSVPAS